MGQISARKHLSRTGGIEITDRENLLLTLLHPSLLQHTHQLFFSFFFPVHCGSLWAGTGAVCALYTCTTLTPNTRIPAPDWVCSMLPTGQLLNAPVQNTARRSSRGKLTTTWIYSSISGFYLWCLTRTEFEEIYLFGKRRPIHMQRNIKVHFQLPITH